MSSFEEKKGIADLQQRYVLGNSVVKPQTLSSLPEDAEPQTHAEHYSETLCLSRTELKCLKTLLLEGNPISELPAELGNVITLKGLNLRYCPISFPPQDIVHQGVQGILQYLRSNLAQRELSTRKDPSDVPVVEKLQLSELMGSSVEEQDESVDEDELQKFKELKQKMILLDKAELGSVTEGDRNLKSRLLPVIKRNTATTKASIMPGVLLFDTQHWKRPEERTLAVMKELQEKQTILEQRRKSHEALRNWRTQAKITQEKKMSLHKQRKNERQNKSEEVKADLKHDVEEGHDTLHRQTSTMSIKECEETRSARELERQIRAHVEKMQERRRHLRGTSSEQMAAAEQDVEERRGDGSLADAIVAPLAGIEYRRAGHFTPGNMEAVAEELRAGSRVPVTIDQIVNDTLVVTLTYRERNYTGILLDCDKKTGLFCLPDFTAKPGDCPLSKPSCEIPEVLSEEPVSNSPNQASHKPKDENTLPESSIPSAPLACPIPTPVPAGQTPYPPYFEGAPFPQPLWVRHSYSQWVPQPPPRPIKRKKRRTREPGRMTMSTIRLRPRQVLCEKCKNTLNSDEDSKDGMSNTKTSRKENALQSDEEGDDKDIPSKLSRKEDVVTSKDTKRRENGTNLDSKRLRKDKRGEADGEKFPGPVIKISYSTPQGKGEVMKIPSRVHGSVKPFCPKHLVQNGVGENGKVPSDPTKEQRHILDATRSGLTVSIPKLKLTRPFTTVGQDLPSPKIRLRPPQREGEENVVEYEAELVEGTRRRSPRVPGPCLPHSDDSGEGKNSLELWSGSSGEEAERGHSDLTLLINFRKRKADSSSLSVCSSDSLDESKSFSSDGTSPELCDLAPGEDLSVTSSSIPSREDCKTVPPLTVRLHTRSMTKCVTEEGHAVAVGDIVWGKIHGFPWWPARVLSISGTRKQETASCEAQWPQAKVAWFGSPTTSQLSVAKLSPFRELFRSRFNRKKKGMYRRAILEAAKAKLRTEERSSRSA
ncbi:hypothetical protein INR49_012395 [Caranx melampygus]|nr:hypothetical protein INR49_012395 [Caranx melampygus]